MYWEEKERTEPYQVPDDVVDMAFAISCRTLPIDHAHALSQALQGALPWLVEEAQAGVHLIHVAESGNGWYRPDDPDKQVLCLSRRTRMTLRMPRHRIDDAHQLSGQSLDIAGHSLEVGRATLRPLSAASTIFARHVVTDATSEDEFMAWAHGALQDMNIRVRKMLPGMEHTLGAGDRTLTTRSLMLADVEPEESVRLQQRGLGGGRKLGCGLFIPHKGIKAVKEAADKIETAAG